MNPPKEKPRLLIVVNVFQPDRGGGGAIFSDLAYGLVERGYDVTVRCAYPYYPEWRDKSGMNGLGIQRYEDHGVHVERYGIVIPSDARSLIQRLVYEASFLFSLARSLPRGRSFDLVMVYCPLVGAVAFAALNKLIHRQPLWLNVQDLSADAAAASGIAKGRVVKNLLAAVQSFMFNRADVWSSIAPIMIERLETIRKRNQPIRYLPNWLNASMAEAIQRQGAKIGRVPERPVRLLYAGNIGGKQGLLRLCQTLHASAAEFVFRVHGNGTEAGEMERWISGTGDERFQFGPFLEEPQFAEALHTTDYFVITEKSGSGGSFVPCKMISGIASGSPILAVCDKESPLGQEVIENGIGPCFSWKELDQIPTWINAGAEYLNAYTAWQESALKRAIFFSRETVIGEFDSALREMLSRKQD